MNPLTLPLGVAARVIGLDLKQIQDDLNVLAGAAARLPEVERELTRRMDELEDTAEAGIAQLQRATEAAEAIVASLPVIEDGVTQLQRAADAGEKLAGEGLDEVRSSREALLEARGQADQLIAASQRAQKALDRASENMELALARAEPLQGLGERLARLNERLPGGRGPGGAG